MYPVGQKCGGPGIPKVLWHLKPGSFMEPSPQHVESVLTPGVRAGTELHGTRYCQDREAVNPRNGLGQHAFF